MEVTVTANDNLGNGVGCFDSLYFKTSANTTFGCNARAGTAFVADNRPVDSPKVFSLPGELTYMYLTAYGDCTLGQIEV